MKLDGTTTPLKSRLDLRVSLFFMMLTSIVSLLLYSETALLALFVILIIWLRLLGLKKQVISHILWYFSLWGGLYLLRYVPILEGTSLPLVTVYVRRLMLPVMAARPVLNASIGRLVASLNRMRLPKAATLSLAILFRFLPTIAEEYRYIRDAQKFRGISESFLSVVRHPLTTMEYTLIPMLIRTSKTADELAASASVRGMRLKGECSSWYLVQMQASDWVTAMIGTIVLVGVFIAERIAGGI